MTVTFVCATCGKAESVPSISALVGFLHFDFLLGVAPPSGWESFNWFVQKRATGIRRSVTFHVCSRDCFRNTFKRRSELLDRETAFLEKP